MTGTNPAGRNKAGRASFQNLNRVFAGGRNMSMNTGSYIAIAALALMLSAPASRAEGAEVTAAPAAESGYKRAVFARESASHDVHHIADWVVDSGDNKGLPFVIIDKPNAKLFVFDAEGRIKGSTVVLLGLARGDDSVPGIGEKDLSEIPPKDRTTPAGRFVAEMGHRTSGEDIVWIDYATAFSMHRVITSKPQERRLQRLATPTIADNRISYGCVNMPIKFYDTVVHPAFSASKGVVYVLPETRPVRVVFNSYDVEEHARQKLAGDAQSPASTHAFAQFSDAAGQ